MSFQRVCCWFAEAFDLGVLSGVEPCADVIVSVAASRRSQNIGARRRGRGGGSAAAVAKRFCPGGFVRGFCPGSSRAPNLLCRRPRTGKFWSAAARRRSQKIGGAAAELSQLSGGPARRRGGPGGGA